jgi:hypothetical protein
VSIACRESIRHFVWISQVPYLGQAERIDGRWPTPPVALALSCSALAHGAAALVWSCSQGSPFSLCLCLLKNTV